MAIMSKFRHKSASKSFGLGSTHPPPHLRNFQIKAEKSASNNLDSGWTPPPFGQSPNASRLAYRLASIREDIMRKKLLTFGHRLREGGGKPKSKSFGVFFGGLLLDITEERGGGADMQFVKATFGQCLKVGDFLLRMASPRQVSDNVKKLFSFWFAGTRLYTIISQICKLYLVQLFILCSSRLCLPIIRIKALYIYKVYFLNGTPLNSKYIILL